MCGTNKCVNISTDFNNCGGCGIVCNRGEKCVDAKCLLDCPPGFLICNGACYDSRNDPQHCGSCGTKCDVGEMCSHGTCAYYCPQSLTNCSGACVDMTSDPLNCGICGNKCDLGEVCTLGRCGIICAPGLALCGSACVDAKKDVNNCGGCGVTCKSGEVCSNGTCVLSCQDGLADCGGVCSNPKVDEQNCGGCGAKCEAGHACENGKCELTCQFGLSNCGKVCVSLQIDESNCGACGVSCKPGELCLIGSCNLVCQNNLKACDGVCVNLQTDPNNCGVCSLSCRPGEVCASGRCAPTCGANLLTCGDICVDAKHDPENCNGCGHKCNLPNVDNACYNGTCGIGACKPGFRDCNGKVADGCEVELANDINNCGMCGKACPAEPHANVICSMGSCVYSCQQNYSDCDGSLGCESKPAEDVRNCGGCGISCAENEGCCGAVCLSTLKDDSNCGSCGKTCGVGQACCGGACLDGKFKNVPSVDCNKPVIAAATAAGGFANDGALDQLVEEQGGLTTIPAANNPPPAQSPYVWIAMHSTHQVNKVDVKTGQVLGTYSSRGQNPSRVGVSLDGSVWVGNRCPGDPNNPNCSNVAQILPDGTPGCTVGNAADGGPMPFVRALAIDGNGFIWAGTYNDHRYHKIDPATCKTIADINMHGNLNGVSYQSWPYGYNVDHDGIMWNSDIGSGGQLLGLDVSDPDPAKNAVKYVIQTGNACRYGMVLDKGGNVYISNCGGRGLFRIDAKTHAYTAVGANSPTTGFGLTIDLDGNIWQGGISKVNVFEGGTGNYIKSYSIPAFNNASGAGSFNNMWGIAGDTAGKVWVTDRSSSSVARLASDGTVEMQTKLPGAECYNYSDWNAIVLKTVTANNAQAGAWTRTIDSGTDQTMWATATWSAQIPSGTSIAVYFKTATDRAQFDQRQFCGPFYAQPVDLTVCNFGKSRYMQVQTILNTNDVNVRPTLSNLSVYYQ